MISGGYARGVGIRAGDTIVLRGPSGTRPARVSGLVDAVSGLPSLFVSLQTMREVYGVTADAQLLLKARSGADPEAFVASVDRLIQRRHPELETLSTAEIKDQIATEINRQFGLFNAMFGIPSDTVFHFCIPLGYPQGRLGPTNRLPIAETCHLNRWGESIG